MNDSPVLSRREMMIGSGLLIAGLANCNLAIGQSTDEKDLIFRTTDPRNGEPTLADLVENWITPVKHFYVRSHAPNPVIDPEKFTLQVEGLVQKPLTLSLDDLSKLEQHTVTATLTCAGNRRAEFNKEGEVGGVQWGPGAIGNAKWTGVRLADVLKMANLTDGARHVWFDGLDQIKRDNGMIPFGASIPIEKAMQTEPEIGALVVTKMNGSPLTADHGFPLRTVVPGYIGARSVKWLGRILVSDQPSTNHYLATAYKIVKQTGALDWQEAGPIYRFPINAAIAVDDETTLSPGKVQVNGYVLPSGITGARVRQVQVSADSGKSWVKAKLTGEDQDYCWRLWSAEIGVTDATTQLIARATDTKGGFMPYRVPWNAKGYLQNSWYRVPVKVQ